LSRWRSWWRAGVTTGHAAPRPFASIFVGCGVPNEFAENFRDYIVDLDTATDAEQAELRDSLQLPVVETSLIQFETDSSTSHRVAVAHAKELETDTLNPERVWALRVGSTRYIVFNATLAG
jgi:hypothetical protein